MRSPASSRTDASTGVRSISARTAVRARFNVRASSACATANRNTTAAASDHWPRAMAPAAAINISTLMSSDRTRTVRHALRMVSGTPADNDRAKNSRAKNGQRPSSASTNRPAVSAPPDATRNTLRNAAPCSSIAIGSSCSSQARMPASATAAAMADAETFAASYFTWSRCPIRSAEKCSSPGSVLNRRSRSATSSRQSIPSTLKVDSACSSQIAQVAMATCAPERAPAPARIAGRCAGRRARNKPCGRRAAPGPGAYFAGGEAGARWLTR